MIYENIEGWFDFHALYLDRVQSASDGDVFVEVGCWMGKSAVFMAEMIKQSGKKIHFFAVDIWEDFEQEGQTHCAPYGEFLKNMAPLKEFIHIIKADSAKAAELFDDNSIDFLFIDANHQYEYVKSDINSWMSKVRGVMAGHDYDWPGVKQAVTELLPDHRVINGNTWIR
jgi:predicted O-methyltransferase YrrM